MRIFHNLDWFILFFLIFLAGCVEHTVTIVVYPDGNFDYDHYAKGDNNDLLDNDFTLPSGELWVINTTTGLGESDDLFYHAFRHFSHNETFPSSFYLGDSIPLESVLNHEVEIDFENRFFSETYRFKITFLGRHASDKYPMLAQYALDNENPPVGWAIEALNYIFTQSLIETDIGFNLQPVAENALNSWLEKINAEYENDGITENFEEIMAAGKETINTILPDNLSELFIKQLAKFEQEAKTTLSLSDDVFEYSLILPGRLYNSNADNHFNDTLQWSFGLGDFLENNHVLTAVSGNRYEARKQWTFITIIVLVIIIFVIYLLKTIPDPRQYSK